MSYLIIIGVGLFCFSVISLVLFIVLAFASTKRRRRYNPITLQPLAVKINLVPFFIIFALIAVSIMLMVLGAGQVVAPPAT